MPRIEENFTMSNIAVTVSREKRSGPMCYDVKKRVLVFSPDADLARFLLMNLEDRFQIIREHPVRTV